MSDTDTKIMRLALQHAERARKNNNTPVGVVIAKREMILGIGENEVRSHGDCTAHAEVIALRNACKNHGIDALRGACCYTTMEPCPMCCWALVEGGIERIVLGARHRQLGRKEYGRYSLERLLELTGRKLAITTGILSDECEALRRDWMRVTGRES